MLNEFNYCYLRIIKLKIVNNKISSLLCATDDGIIRTKVKEGFDKNNIEFFEKNIDRIIKVRFYKVFRVKYVDDVRGLFNPQFIEFINSNNTDTYKNIKANSGEVINDFKEDQVFKIWSDRWMHKKQKDRAKPKMINPWRKLQNLKMKNLVDHINHEASQVTQINQKQ